MLTLLESLSNELIYEIFEYLHLHHIFQAFYDLNERFQYLSINSNLPIKVDIASMSLATCEQFFEHIVSQHAARVKSLRLSSPFMLDTYKFLFPLMTNFTQLESLSLTITDGEYVKQMLDQLFSLPSLSSLTITSTVYISNKIYPQLFRLPTLKSCRMLLKTYDHMTPNRTKEFSSIEHLVVNQRISFEELDALVSYVPNVHHLSIHHLSIYQENRRARSSFTLNYLTKISLKMNDVKFSNFESIVVDYFRHVQILHLLAQSERLYENGTDYLDTDRWKRLISMYIPNLRTFRFQHVNHNLYSETDRQIYQACVVSFDSVFWTEHNWFFEWQYHPQSRTAIFFSRNSKRKHHDQTKNMWSSMNDINQDPIHHIYLHDLTPVQQYAGEFPHVNELTFLETFYVPDDSLGLSLQLILPVIQLTKLTINCLDFPFEQLLELFRFASNVHTLQLFSLALDETDSICNQQNGLVRLASQTNRVVKVIIEKTIRLEQLKLLTILFPRLENLLIDLYRQDLKTIAEYLWSKSNNHTRYLYLLCIAHERENLLNELNFLIKSEKLLSRYALKVIEKKLYVWW
ncbi:unnamed protein product [Adineta ricciae]|uniref:F-box domain-containing protein n=1 Tax=Adineta ricciae TaxID=249248 RepID=A0A815LZL4_ADIRI|nr:unnamed protein product [Adineta ricciae]CAF1409757.1 unnamed protein product [Adineta ricciae]